MKLLQIVARCAKWWADAAARAFNPTDIAPDKIACARCGKGFSAMELRPVDLGFLCGPCDVAELTEYRVKALNKLIDGPQTVATTCFICGRTFRVRKEVLIYCAASGVRWHCSACTTFAKIAI